MTGHPAPWYASVTRYQWLVLTVASLGWVFDAFEGQLYNITRGDMLPDLLRVTADAPSVKLWGERFLGIFLIGGTFGGWLFSSLADRWGRNPVMALTILFYSLFSGLTALATDAWHVGALRFLVAMGVGGEWAVGAALVSEVFPKEARERAGGIFHATSVGGLWLAAAAGLAVGSQWRVAYLLGVAPAILVLWVRLSIREPESWQEARQSKAERLGSFRELLGDPRWQFRALGGALLAMVGLATFWGVVVAGQDIARDLLERMNDPAAARKAKVAFGFVQTAGAGLGMLAFGPLAARIGCRGTFAIMHIAAAAMTPIVCWLPSIIGGYPLLLCLLPIFGFFAQGIHAGYAVYFPTLFPTHLRATGSGFCFNTGRLLAAPVLIWLSAWMKATFDLRLAVTCLGSFFLLGLVFLMFLPETRGMELPE
ncbi:MAG: MFS transporter [Planctomycetota bacterium]|jgi:predicted MFS family arabinose efflux permease|nr:MFS transporter [Planctomycetota bacterium]